MSKFISRALDRCNTNAKKQTKEQSNNPPPPYSYIFTGGSTTATPTNIMEGYVCPAGFYCTAGALVEEGCAIGTYQVWLWL